LHVGAVVAAAVVAREAVAAGENFRFDVFGKWRQQGALARIGRPTARGQLGALEKTLRTLVEAIEEVAADPLGDDVTGSFKRFGGIAYTFFFADERGCEGVERLLAGLLIPEEPG